MSTKTYQKVCIIGKFYISLRIVKQIKLINTMGRMILRFAHPCNGSYGFKDTFFKRTIPQAGTTKKRIDFAGNNFDWNFTQNDYYFHLEYREEQGIPNFKLYFSENPDDCWDWQEIKDCEIIFS